MFVQLTVNGQSGVAGHNVLYHVGMENDLKNAHVLTPLLYLEGEIAVISMNTTKSVKDLYVKVTNIICSLIII